MSGTPASIVVVSRGRPEALVRCLTAIAQLQYDPFEVVVVADPKGIYSVSKLPFRDDFKLIEFNDANISAARNAGIAAAAGEVIAFIDDDAVPEPTWLSYLTAPAGQAAAMGGFVRGRNGISFQWQARAVNARGDAEPMDVHPQRATVLHPPGGRAVKTEGTNMAVRRDALVALGGFDPAFRYFLDETDVNLRLARAGHATAITPMAQVHHGFAGNAVRDRRRVPRDLFQIGASWALFYRKHLPEGDRAAAWADVQAGERRRLLGHMQAGGLTPDDVGRLMRGLRAGYADGLRRPLGAPGLPAQATSPFKRFPAKRRLSRLMVTRPARFRRDMEEARARVAKGEIVTLLSLSRTTLYHRVFFDPSGVWVQRGGLFGRAERSEPLILMTTRSRRVEKERRRVALLRAMGDDNE